MDYSSRVTIINNTSFTLNFRGSQVEWGSWVDDPPQSIYSHSSGQMLLKDKAGVNGSEGEVTYALAPTNETQFVFGFSCGWSDNNYVNFKYSEPTRFAVTYTAQSGDGPVQQNSCPTRGHPLVVVITISSINQNG